MKTNTHGYPMNGLEEASNATGGWPKNSGGYTQISYDMDTGDVMTDDHADQNSWMQYRDDSIITVFGTQTHMSAQAIADKIAYHMDMRKEYSD